MMEIMSMYTPTSTAEECPLDEEALKRCLNPEDTPWLGRCRVFFYRNHNPLITIGPHCIIMHASLPV